MIGKMIKEKIGSGITPTNNETKDVIRVMKPLEF